MLAARVPTAVSRQDLTRCDSDVSSEGGKAKVSDARAAQSNFSF